ncbi:hypothetical protein [Tenacibaculum sp. 190524A02b]|uniref:hypothetical protein n=1 Tax=Tenacibaculum vairaonense TaxID=3137860 RepID=UPI0031FA5AE1
MKIKLKQLTEISTEESIYIIGGQVQSDKKKKGKKRKSKRVCNSDATDTVKNDTF